MFCYMHITTSITTQKFSFTIRVFELSLSKWTWIISTFHSFKRWWWFGVKALCQRGINLWCWMIVELHSLAPLKTLVQYLPNIYPLSCLDSQNLSVYLWFIRVLTILDFVYTFKHIMGRTVQAFDFRENLAEKTRTWVCLIAAFMLGIYIHILMCALPFSNNARTHF